MEKRAQGKKKERKRLEIETYFMFVPQTQTGKIT